MSMLTNEAGTSHCISVDMQLSELEHKPEKSELPLDRI